MIITIHVCIIVHSECDVPPLSYAAAVLVSTGAFVAVAVVLLIWCMRRHGCLGRPANGPDGSGDDLEDGDYLERHPGGSDFEGGDDRDDGDHFEGDDDVEDEDTRTPRQTSGSDMTRIRYVPVRNVPKKDASRADTEIELKVVEANSMSEPAVKPQVDMDLSLNQCLP
jgi:hypothetical protein